MIRPALPEDVDEIHALICDLADFEKLRHEVRSTPADFHAALFGEAPLLEALVSEHSSPHSGTRLIGTALFHRTFSTFTGKPGLWLEDVYVRPEHRKEGLGKAFLQHLLGIARERNCARVEWSVLDWNQDAIRFYENLGADVMPDWRICRISF